MKKSKLHAKSTPVRSWIEATFTKRECIKFIPHPEDESRCCCDRTLEQHKFLCDNPESIPSEIWVPSKCTAAYPTDANGTLEFQGGPHPSKAQYIRVSYDTKPEHLLQLLNKEWNLELPKLLISIQGGKANFELPPKLKKVLRKGLLKAARSTGAWIFTGGTNTGVTKHVGEALLLERSQRTGRVLTLGIAPWGIVENNQELIGHNKEVPYHSISSPRSRFAALNNRHAYFLLVDNGTVAKYGAEIVLRRRLEKYISKQRLYPFTQSPIPIVCLVIEGGTNTIRAVLEYVMDDPPVPVVVCDGSGRAADLIAFMCRYENKVIKSMKEYLISTIQKYFEVNIDMAEHLFEELKLCHHYKHLITIYRIAEKDDQKSQDLDQTILTAIFKSDYLSPTEQLSLALTWNRADIARSEIFVYGQEWPQGSLEDAMMKALEYDRCDFVKLLLENGVSMRKFLTIPRLENLYNSKAGPSNTLGYILRDVRPHIPAGYVYTLHDIGLVINKLMGGAYRAFYTRRKFRPIYAKVMNKGNMQRNSSSFARQYGNAMSLLAGALPSNANPCLFDYPFNELLIWAVLMKRHKMALVMWQHGEEALAKALVATKLYKAMAREAAEDDLETEVYEELRSYGKEFENIGLEVLDYCYRQDDDQTQQLLTCELQNWSGQTCLSLAVAANHRALLAHPCAQIILADLWMGGLRTRKSTNLKVIMGLICPPYILKLEFKSKEELQLMPQREEEHLELENEDDDKSESDKNPDAEALLTETFIPRDTIVQENGKIYTGVEDGTLHVHYCPDYGKVPKQRQLKIKKKLYEFYTAPISKFWANSVAYLAFLIIFSYTILVRMDMSPSWQEWTCIAFICSLGCEKIRELVSTEPVGISQKLAVWSWNMWNPCDMGAVTSFLIGVILRFRQDTFEQGRVIYCVNSIYWYLRILNILSVNKYLGPLVTMMGKMVKNMIYFVVLLLIVLMSFGVTRQAILFPDKEPSWAIARDVFLEPYFMLYGEVYADKIDPPCGGEDEEECRTGRWISPTIMSIYLLVANILLINLLIAVFNNIFNEVNAVAHQVWMFQRFTVVMEYEQKPILPPPFIAFSHIYLIFKYLKRKMAGQEESYDNGLKLFFDRDEMETLYDFEEDCVEGYFAEQELKLQQSTEERIKVTTERIEHLTQKVEDINAKTKMNQGLLNSLECRCRKTGDDAEEALQLTKKIQRMFLQTQKSSREGVSGSKSKDSLYRKQSTQEVTPDEDKEALEELDEVLTEMPELSKLLTGQPRKRVIVRSLTEVRPDAYIFDNGEHIEYRHPEQEEDVFNEHLDAIAQAEGKRNLPSIMRQRTKSTDSKASVDSFCEKIADSEDLSADDLAALSLDALRNRCAQRRRDSGSGRRNSEGEGNGNSEEPIVIRNLVHPRIFEIKETTFEIGSGQRKRNCSEMSNPEIAINLEKAHLRNAEESDYMVMENLIQRKYDEEDDDDEGQEEIHMKHPAHLKLMSETREYRLNSWPSRQLMRSSAVEEHPTSGVLGTTKQQILKRMPFLKHHAHALRHHSLPANVLQQHTIADGTKHNLIKKYLTSLPTPSRSRCNSETNDCIVILREQTVNAINVAIGNSSSSERQTSSESTTSCDNVAAGPAPPERPSIILDSSQLPFQTDIKTAESQSSLHMQSETMC